MRVVTSRIFSMGTKFEKYGPFYDHPMLRGGFIAEARNEKALPRRQLFASSFSLASVRRFEERIVTFLNKFLTILQTEYEQNDKPLDLTLALTSLMADTILNYAFERPFGNLDTPGFESQLILATEDLTRLAQWSLYFGSIFGKLFQFIEILPHWVREKYMHAIMMQQWGLQVR